jgi:hypothetical protein
MNPIKSSKYQIITLLLVLILITGHGLFAQSLNFKTNFRPQWSLNVSAGTSLFFGDIKQYQYVPVSNYENEWRFAGGLQLGYQISPVVGLRGQGIFGKLAGTRRPSNLYFEASYIELNLNTTVSIRNIFSTYRDGQFWDVYLIAGVGLTNYNSTLMELSSKKVLRKIGYGNGVGFGGRTVEGLLIGGMGLKLNLSDQWTVNLESANRVLNSDLLDGKESGFKYDVYNYSSLGFTYKFARRTPSTKSKGDRTDEYDYFESSKKDKKVPETRTEPVQPAEIDMLFVAPPVLNQPVEPPKKEVPQVIEEKKAEVFSPVVNRTIEEKPMPVKSEAHAGIEYRVQIMAKYGNTISTEKLSKMYNLPASHIQQNTHNGFYIYTVGSFTTYEAARVKRNELRSTNGIVDAFVVAFKADERLDKLP